MTGKTMRGEWNYPTNIIAGAAAVEQLATCCRQLGMGSPLLVTDPGLAALPLMEAARRRCSASGLHVGVFSEVKSNPNANNIAAGVAAFRQGQYDGVIAFGGGSALDAGKTIALMAGQSLPLWSYEDVGDNWARLEESGMAPVVAVPTTAGTGSEVGRAAVITDQDTRVKRLIFHPKMLPGRVILDPELTLGLPPSLTAATGMDALSHNLEALCSPAFHPMADAIALEGMRLVQQNLPEAVVNGHDVNARMHMLVASSMGATAFQKGLGAMHALAHPLGALYDAHHGLLNAVLMPYVLQANRSAIGARLARASRYLNLIEPGFDGFLDWVLGLRRHIGIPHTLADIGIDASEATRVGEMALVDPAAAGNPVPFTASEYSDIFSRAVNGDL